MSKKRPKISLFNLLRSKKMILTVAVCAVVAFGAYVGIHMFSSEARTNDPGQQRGILNDINDIKGKKKGGNRNIGIDGNQLGSQNNPFVILEIVPWQGYGEMSYMISGCEPANIYKTYTGTAMTGLDAMNMGLAVSYAFEEEDYPGKEGVTEYGEVTRPWELSDKEMTMYGYYEKVNPSKSDLKPQFVIGDVEEDENGNVHPVFRKATEGETAEYIWVTMDSGQGSIYTTHKKKENVTFAAGSTLAQVKAKLKTVGDRYYTSRTDRVYCMGSMPDATSKYYHCDDFLRYSLRLREKYKVDHFNIMVKTVEPWELNEHPEWIDYADLMYIHASNEYGASVQFYNTAAEKGLLYIDKDKSKNVNGANFGRYGSGEYKDKQNDISFDVAMRLFLKANKFDQYDGKTVSATDSNMISDYAPIIVSCKLYTEVGNYADSISNSPTKMMDWETMRPAEGARANGTAYNNNVYKFCLMDLLMDQKVFYNNFIRKRVSTGKSVVQTDANGNGIAEPQSGDAQLYWNIYTFMPFDNNVGHWKLFKDKYKLKTDAGASTAPYYTGNQGVNNFSMVYNNNGKIYYLSNQDDFSKSNSSMNQAFGFYDDIDESRETLSTLDVIYYMLNYGGSSGGGDGSSGQIQILDIEPCSDFTKMNVDYMMILFPSGDDYSFEPDDFNITHMTTAEFNSSKEDLAKYDMVYFGNSTGKMNAETKSTYAKDALGNSGNITYTAPLYNDSDASEKIFLHVGDVLKGDSSTSYRLSGNDITSIKQKALVEYVKSGRALVLPDSLYMGSSSTLYSKSVGKGTHTDSMLSSIRKKENVYALSTLKSSNAVDFARSGAKVKITDTPPKYNNPSDATSVKDDADEGSKVNVTPIQASKDEKGNTIYNLAFTFSIGYTSNADEKYAVRLLVDKNGDGIISENETGADILDTWNSNVSAGQTFDPGELDEKGKEDPKEYTVYYTIPEEQTNGPIAWKFIVYNTQNESIYYEVSGVSLYKGEKDDDGEAVVHEINVLQVVEDDKKGTSANLESDAASLFKKYAKLDDYKITVKTVTLSEYLKHFADVNSSDYSGDSTSRTLFEQAGNTFYYPVDYMDYNVFLYSCGKSFQKADDKDGAVSFAAWAPNNDKSVVYTKDSIYASSSNESTRNVLKDAAGLSRYTSSDSVTSRYNDTAKDASGKKYKTENYTSLEYSYYRATLSANTSNKYLAYKNGTWQQVDGKSKMAYGAGRQQTKRGSRTNEGTVCIYPYTIGESLSLTGAEAQDYQLNLEIPDADVWYCLGDNQGRGDAAGKLDTYYAMSPNDGANNYYLYNVGNTFYDGIDLEATTKDQEMQLFINTLIGAYEFSYGTPYVTVDKVTKLDGTQEKLQEDKITTAERDYSFEVTAGHKVEKTTLYKEYLEREKDQVVHSAKPKATPTPEPSTTPEPKPTTTPTPVTLYENTMGQTNQGFTMTSEGLKGLSNKAIIQFTYTSTEDVDPNSGIWDVYGGDNEWTKKSEFTACVGKSTKATDIQIVQMTIADLKDLLGVSENQDIQVLTLRPHGWYCPTAKLLTVKLYQEGYSGDFDTGGGSSTDDATSETVTKKEVFSSDDTHIIFFTPHEGNVKGSVIKSFMLQFAGVDNETGNAINLPVTTIYRSLGSGEYEKITCPTDKPGQFNETLIDGRQYFVTYNKENANPKNEKIFDKLEMHIQNDRKQSKTILQITGVEAIKEDTEDVYMFNLD